jgi:hypothetical protein
MTADKMIGMGKNSFSRVHRSKVYIAAQKSEWDLFAKRVSAGFSRDTTGLVGKLKPPLLMVFFT